MKKEDKSLVIDKIANTIRAYSGFYLVETAGLNAEKTSELRRKCFEADVKLMVVKNTLLHKALESLDGDYAELYPRTEGLYLIDVYQRWQCSRKASEGLPSRKVTLYPLSRPLMSKRQFMSVLTSSTLSLRSRARTNLSQTLSHSFSRLPRTLFLPLLLVAASSTVSSRHFQKKKTNSIRINNQIKLYKNGRFKSFC